jgi:SAM-dependent methyltransferase
MCRTVLSQGRPTIVLKIGVEHKKAHSIFLITRLSNQNMKKMYWFRNTFLQHPLIKDLDSSDPNSTHVRRRIIQEKAILNRIYQDWYGEIICSLPISDKPILEIGSGASFLKNCCGNLITSDIMYYQGIDSVLDAQSLPIMAESLNAIVMTDVFHHLPKPRSFFEEAYRCIQPGGKIIMVEPWVTPWSTYVFKNWHHEPFDPTAITWEYPVEHPLSGANGALPWIVFQRDKGIFENEFHHWQINKIKPIMPFLYLASGGISSKEILPGFFYEPIKFIEKMISPINKKIAMFALIAIQRN